MFVGITFQGEAARYANVFFMQERTLFKHIEYSVSGTGFR